MNFSRGLRGLRAALLHQYVVVAGGEDDENKFRDEVFLRNSSPDLSPACLQVLRYFPLHNVWSEIGQMKRGVSGHAIVEVNLDAICSALLLTKYIF